VVTLAMAWLGARTPLLPMARSARVAILALGIAGICSVFCPDRHFLGWWDATPSGRALSAIGGLPLSALCFGAVTTFVFGAVATFVVVGRHRTPMRPLLPAAMLVLLLLPGVALQSVGTSWSAFASWLLGTAAGAYGGVAVGVRVRTRLLPG